MVLREGVMVLVKCVKLSVSGIAVKASQHVMFSYSAFRNQPDEELQST